MNVIIEDMHQFIANCIIPLDPWSPQDENNNILWAKLAIIERDSQGGRGKLVVYFTSPQSFLIRWLFIEFLLTDSLS